MRDTSKSWLQVGDTVRVLGRSISGGNTHNLEGTIEYFDSNEKPVVRIRVNQSPGLWSVEEEQCVLLHRDDCE